MSPTEFVEEMKSNLKLNGILNPKQVLESQTFLDEGFRYIAKRIEENYNDMSPEAVKMAMILQSFILVFVEHANNFALMRDMEAS